MAFHGVGATARVESVALRSVDESTEARVCSRGQHDLQLAAVSRSRVSASGDGVGAYLREGKTMGIPLLHPWANRLNGFRYRVAGERWPCREAST